MKVFRALQNLWSTAPKRLLVQGLRWLIGIAAVLAVLSWLVVGATWYFLIGTHAEKACSYEVLGNVSGVTGFDFETSIRDCWHNPETSVFVSKAGGGKKTVLFSYYSPDAPTITAIDDRTIQIALGEIDHVFCRTDEWQGLTVKYVIQSIRYPGRDEPRECERLLLLDVMGRMVIFLDLMLRLAASRL